ncbi:MAG: SH3 domain-containing protein [Clostridia bacterium]|nr:SH3 domain-containing protein [Clostridia bacterium]
MSGYRGAWRLTALLVALCCLCGAAAAQEPAYASTRAFVAMLQQAGVPYEAQGLDESGEECLAILLEEINLYAFFSADGAEICFIAWYVIEYAPEDEVAVLKACNRLNAASDGPRFCADDSDHSVTAMLDVVLPWNAAGSVAWQGYRSMAGMLAKAQLELRPLSIAQPQATPAPTATSVPQATSAPANNPEQPSRVMVSVATARVRSGPGVTSPYLFTAQQGEAFAVIGISGTWYIITSNGRTGFISMESVTPIP